MDLDPFLADIRRRLAGRPSLAELGVDAARAAVRAGRAFLGKGPAMHRSEAIQLPTRDGPLRALLHWPVEVPKGLIVYLHGGGWVLGELADFDIVVTSLAEATGCAVLVPEYRLAPEHPYPAALHDCIDVLANVSGKISRLTSGAGPLVVMGDSAGANLATVALRHLRGRVAVDLQVLVYPVTDCAFDRPSYVRQGDLPPLRRADMEWFLTQYAPKALWTSPDISPVRSTDLAGMPPATIVVAEADVLHDEGLDYAERLRACGVPVAVRIVKGATHGFLPFVNHVKLAREELMAVADAIAKLDKQTFPTSKIGQ